MSRPLTLEETALDRARIVRLAIAEGWPEQDYLVALDDWVQAQTQLNAARAAQGSTMRASSADHVSTTRIPGQDGRGSGTP